MLEPPTKVVLFIEDKATFLIDMIPPEVRYTTEADAILIRSNTVTGPANAGLPLHEVSSKSSP